AMQCIDTHDRLLADYPQHDAELTAHVAECSRCTHIANGLKRVDQIARASLIIVPPLELQHQLAQIALQAARPQPRPWWQQLPRFDLSAWLAQSPQMSGAQSLAALLVGLASWQVFGWLSAVQPVVGDVGYAMQLVAGSPAGSYLSGVQIDLQGLGL